MHLILLHYFGAQQIGNLMTCFPYNLVRHLMGLVLDSKNNFKNLVVFRKAQIHATVFAG